MTTHKRHKKWTPMPQEGFEPAMPASEWPQIHALDPAANGIGKLFLYTPLRNTSVEVKLHSFITSALGDYMRQGSHHCHCPSKERVSGTKQIGGGW